MRVAEAMTLARSLGRLKDQEGVDEATRRTCVDAIEMAIQHIGSSIDKSDTLREFRKEAKVLSESVMKRYYSHETNEGGT